MIPQPITIDGRAGTVLYINAQWQPVDPATATMARVLFDDGGTAFYTVTPLRTLDKDAGGHGSYKRGEGPLSDAQTPRIQEAKIVNDALVRTTLHVYPVLPGSPSSNRLDKLGVEAVSEEMRKAMKEHVVDGLTARLARQSHELDLPGLPLSPAAISDFVKQRVDGWARTSGDHDGGAARRQMAVKAEFDLTDAPTDHLTGSDGQPWYTDADDTTQEVAADRIYARAEYDQTQKWLKDQGLEYVSIYRGTGRETTEQKAGPTITNDVLTGAVVPEGTRDVTLQPASSWTTSLRIAMGFGYMGSVLSARVPVSRVLSTAVTGRGCLAEAEVIILGGKLRVHSVESGQVGKIADNERIVQEKLAKVWR